MTGCPHRWDWWPDTPEQRALGFGVPALRYAELGYRVLPVQPGGKRPHRMLGERGGVHWATADGGKIRRWWSQDPAAGIGVATGAPSRLAVIDLDVKGSADGPASLRAFLGPGNTSLWPHPVARTPSGGYHIWMRIAGSPERPGILPGADVKGDGGYVLAAPSCRLLVPGSRDGERSGPVPVPYTWERGCPCSVPPAPEWLPGWLASAPARPASPPGGDGLAALDELKRTGIPRGERNHTLYRVACSLYRRLGTGPGGAAAVTGQLARIWQAGDTSGFSWQELLRVAESARAFIEREQEKERAQVPPFMAWMRRQGG